MSQEEFSQIGERLRQARKRAGVTQEQAAAEVKVARSTISNWEAGRNLPCLLQFRHLTNLYAASPARILNGRSIVELTRHERVQILEATRSLDESLMRRVDLLLQMLDPA